ncbi:MAG: YciI family protein [Propionibacteriaceae bacterium]|nr:YciI family protein [Propionibacteriaceae bacterium]
MDNVLVVNYTYIADPDAIAEHRPAHRAFLKGLADEGVLLLSGPMASGVGQPDAGLLVFASDSPEDVLARLGEDPFQKEGIVANVEVRGWTPVLGAWLDRVSGEDAEGAEEA